MSMGSARDIHLYTANTMNGWKPLIFLHEAEVDYELTPGQKPRQRWNFPNLDLLFLAGVTSKQLPN